jgi:poly-beta-1,6-N-acetyl-D-glucosamine synthase
MKNKYVIITPVRDEEKFIEAMIRSVAEQVVKPIEWIIVNDGSTDRTASIIERYAKEYPWIHVVHRANRGFRKSGGGVAEAFYSGYSELRSRDWDFIVKLDGDLVLETSYFQRCFERFHRNERLGIGGGTVYHILDGREHIEEGPRFHVRGATKIYRRECWEAIGGLWQAPGWDTIDEAKAQMLGWSTETFVDIKLLQQRPTGTSESLWADQVKGGLARYVSGYHPFFILASFMSRLLRKRHVKGAVALLYGYTSGYIKRIPQVNDTALIQFVRREQMKRLLGRQTVWK